MKWLKYLSVALVIFFVSFIGLFLYVKTAFPPEKIKKITLTQLKKSFPKAQFKINSITTSFFISLDVEVDGLEVIGSEGKPLLKVEKVKRIHFRSVNEFRRISEVLRFSTIFEISRIKTFGSLGLNFLSNNFSIIV